MAAERGNTVFWNLLSARDDVDRLGVDNEGNTPLMAAVAAGQPDILHAWILHLAPQESDLNITLTIQNKAGLNLFMLIVENLNETMINLFIEAVDLSLCIDEKDKAKYNALLHLCTAEKWSSVEQLLNNSRLDEVAMDVHPTDKLGNSALVLTLLARVKAERQLQNYKVKKDLMNEKSAQREVDQLWRIVILLMGKERDLHGMSINSGRDIGIQCLKDQMDGNRKIE